MRFRIYPPDLPALINGETRLKHDGKPVAIRRVEVKGDCVIADTEPEPKDTGPEGLLRKLDEVVGKIGKLSKDAKK
jgi:hypothetical protein